MRRTSFTLRRGISSTLTRIASSRTHRAAAVAILAGSMVIGGATRGANHKTTAVVHPLKLGAVTSATQATGPGNQKRLLSRLTFQPEANKMRRKLGKRFVEAGREVNIATGVLTLGSVQHSIRIVRTQDEKQGEEVSIAIGANATFVWSPKAGAVLNGNALTGNERAIVERIALDGPDQFVLAQTRGASYYTIARTVRPAEAGDSEKYSGPLWDLIRIAEPQRGNWNKPQSLWRVYYVNNFTGLIDRVFSQEENENLTVELSEWSDHGGELVPLLIRWIRGGNLVMQLRVSSVSYGPKS